jgi:predicted alpha/beta hydrolase family esterase
MKKVYLIHGWGGSSRGGWFDWVRDRLLEKDIEVRAFDMPDTDHPNIERWVDFIKNNILTLDSETYFVGHSVGCQAIMRFLETIDDPAIQIKGCVFVAGWFNLKKQTFEDAEDIAIAKPWLETKIDFAKVKQHCKNFLAIFSDDDPYVPTSDEKLFKKNLGAEIIVKQGEDHFNKKYQMPEILNFILQ